MAGGPKIPTIPKSFVSNEQTWTDTFPIPSARVRFIIGKERKQIISLASESGAEIWVDKTITHHGEVKWQNVMIKGNDSQVLHAKRLLVELLLKVAKKPLNPTHPATT